MSALDAGQCLPLRVASRAARNLLALEREEHALVLVRHQKLLRKTKMQIECQVLYPTLLANSAVVASLMSEGRVSEANGVRMVVTGLTHPDAAKG